jgi:hypothetical protein
MTATQLAGRYGVSNASVRRLLRLGLLKGKRTPNGWEIPESQFQRIEKSGGWTIFMRKTRSKRDKK